MEKSIAFDDDFIEFCKARGVEQNEAYRALESLAYEIASHERQAANALQWARDYLESIAKYGMDAGKCASAATACTEAHGYGKAIVALRAAFRGQLRLAFGPDMLSDWTGRRTNAVS